MKKAVNLIYTFGFIAVFVAALIGAIVRPEGYNFWRWCMIGLAIYGVAGVILSVIVKNGDRYSVCSLVIGVFGTIALSYLHLFENAFLYVVLAIVLLAILFALSKVLKLDSPWLGENKRNKN